MHGNLWEWVYDCYDADAYKGRSPYPIPAPLVDDSGCGSRVLRGGSFFSEPKPLRSADRDGLVLEVWLGFMKLGKVRSTNGWQACPTRCWATLPIATC